MKTNKEYIEAVTAGNYPENPFVPIDAPFTDERGKIINLLINPPQIGCVSVITSKAGTVRSQHYHKEDYHYLYLVTGSCTYYERSLDGTVVREPLTLFAGQMVFTPPMMVHKVVYLEDCIMLSVSKRPRDHESHESDVVREEY